MVENGLIYSAFIQPETGSRQEKRRAKKRDFLLDDRRGGR